MIDAEGFRPNVGMILADGRGRVLWARRAGQDAWQFPQGGIKPNESPEQALFRELEEEVGLYPGHVRVLASTRGWLRYRLPQRLVRNGGKGPVCIGQKQKWFLLEFLGDDAAVNLGVDPKRPEFDGWEWVSYWYPVNQVVAFKCEVYRRAMKELCPRHSRLVADNLAQRAG
ncbi:MAG TPA: RNA pyrophosphohydrolase [Spongiibacteraceae bacterium]|nr:RNA pyrophosphohydrolase [Spongiibacteraceae bacterium]HCS25898.1 RNA pyrophosphohydrolase [Spongiibacteraceae bacterium]